MATTKTTETSVTKEQLEALAKVGIFPTKEAAVAARAKDGSFPKGVPFVQYKSRRWYGSGMSASRLLETFALCALGCVKDYEDKPSKARQRKQVIEGLAL